MSKFPYYMNAACLALALTATATPGALLAQLAPAPQAAAVAVAAPMPSQADLHRMIWSTMANVDSANLSGNYSVLRETAAPGFQQANDTQKLVGIFTALRNSGIDLSQAMLLAPTFRAPPKIVQPGLMQVQGVFSLRPNAINFQMLYQWVGGKWRLFGVSISTTPLPVQQEAAKAIQFVPNASPPPQQR